MTADLIALRRHLLLHPLFNEGDAQLSLDNAPAARADMTKPRMTWRSTPQFESRPEAGSGRLIQVTGSATLTITIPKGNIAAAVAMENLRAAYSQHMVFFRSPDSAVRVVSIATSSSQTDSEQRLAITAVWVSRRRH